MPRDGAIIVGDLAGKVDVRTRNRDTQKSPAGALPCPTRYGAPRGGRSRAGEALLARRCWRGKDAWRTCQLVSRRCFPHD